ncbi:hypothetical protein [uncultured Umboniibacter sp.]|uniref:hypothetical protein n=1 Tax=uncultured Umboniibacter sp. TaxID=1798917 RepID=UPI002638467E|nr:hypothetical protein [uncultured Umboniibacter sp.]
MEKFNSRLQGSALLTGLILMMLATLAVVAAVSMSNLSVQHQALRTQRDDYRAQSERFFDQAQQQLFDQGLVIFSDGSCYSGRCFMGHWTNREKSESCERNRDSVFQPEVPYLAEAGGFDPSWMTRTESANGANVYSGIEFLCFLNLDGTRRPYLRASFAVGLEDQQGLHDIVFITQEGWLLYGVW